MERSSVEVPTESIEVGRETDIGGDNASEMGSLDGGRAGLRGERLNNFWREGAKRAAILEPRDGEEFVKGWAGKAGNGLSSCSGTAGISGLSREIRYYFPFRVKTALKAV